MFSKCRTDAFRKMSMKCFALSYNIKKEERLLEMHKSNFVENGTNINFRSSVKASEANSTESLKSGFSRTFRLVYNNELSPAISDKSTINFLAIITSDINVPNII
ncbi:hypothetical protein RB195_015399 [Necator americanus]|uniref:Uncharacterized protein n=1 Tax=Necator americanus TaxID=51031 RepID=A0ABR1E4E8_NECAM